MTRLDLHIKAHRQFLVFRLFLYSVFQFVVDFWTKVSDLKCDQQKSFLKFVSNFVDIIGNSSRKGSMNESHNTAPMLAFILMCHF